MDAIKYLKVKEKMCDFYKSKEKGCYNCKLSSANNNKQIGCSFFVMRYPEEAVKVVEDFDKMHKTILDDFKEKCPNLLVPLDDEGDPLICPLSLGYNGLNCNKVNDDCHKCWNMPLNCD